MSKWKITDSLGFSTLINYVKQTKQVSDGNTSDISDLRDDIQGLASQTAETFQAVDTALETMDSEKQDLTNEVSATIPVTGWKEDTSVADYPKYYDLTATGITAVDSASVYIAPASIGAAVNCGICPTCETLAGKIRIRSAQVPSSAISVRYWIEKGKV